MIYMSPPHVSSMKHVFCMPPNPGSMKLVFVSHLPWHGPKAVPYNK